MTKAKAKPKKESKAVEPKVETGEELAKRLQAEEAAQPKRKNY